MVREAEVCWMKIVSSPVEIPQACEPSLDLPRKFIQALASRRDLQLRGLLRHSTVTLLARLRGWSTSQPSRTAMWYASN